LHNSPAGRLRTSVRILTYSIRLAKTSSCNSFSLLPTPGHLFSFSPSFMWSLPESRLSLLLLGLWLAGIWPLRTQAQSVPAPRTSFVTRSPCLPGAPPQRTGAVSLPPEVGLLQEPAVPSLTALCPQSPRISASPPQNRKNPSSPGAPVSRYGVIVIAAVGAVYATHLLRAIAVTSPPPT